MDIIVSACGLLCSKCPAYEGTIRNDPALIEKTAAEWSVQFGVEVRSDDVWCTGCMTEGARKSAHCAVGCEIRKCVKARGYESCALCADRPDCAHIAYITTHVPPAGQLLDTLAAFKNHFCPDESGCN